MEKNGKTLGKNAQKKQRRFVHSNKPYKKKRKPRCICRKFVL